MYQRLNLLLAIWSSNALKLNKLKLDEIPVTLSELWSKEAQDIKYTVKEVLYRTGHINIVPQQGLTKSSKIPY